MSKIETDFDNNFEMAVDSAFDADSNEILSNSSSRHASYLMQKLLEKAAKTKREVRIVSGALSPSVFNQSGMINALRQVIQNEVKVTVLTETKVLAAEGETDHQFASLINDTRSSSLHTSSTGELKLGNGKPLPHFLLVGESAFRLETNHDSVTAFGCFNNQHVGKKLKMLFDKTLAEKFAPANA